MKSYWHWTIVLASAAVCWVVWPTVADYTSKEIQPIASAVATVAGILFGFIMGTITMFASAKDNTLVRNSTLIGYLPKLVALLHTTMGFLLLVCLIFLAVLFIPDTSQFAWGDKGVTYRCASAITLVGVFFLLSSFCLFGVSWYKFHEFVKHM